MSLRYRVLRSYGFGWFSALVIATLNNLRYGPAIAFPVNVRFMHVRMCFLNMGADGNGESGDAGG